MQTSETATLAHARGPLSARHAVPAEDIAGRVERAMAWADALAAVCRMQMVQLPAAAGRTAEVVPGQAAGPAPRAGMRGVPAAPGAQNASLKQALRRLRRPALMRLRGSHVWQPRLAAAQRRHRAWAPPASAPPARWRGTAPGRCCCVRACPGGRLPTPRTSRFGRTERWPATAHRSGHPAGAGLLWDPSYLARKPALPLRRLHRSEGLSPTDHVACLKL